MAPVRVRKCHEVYGRRDLRTSIDNHNGTLATFNPFLYLTDDSGLEGGVVGVQLMLERHEEAIIPNFLKYNVGRNSNVPGFDLVYFSVTGAKLFPKFYLHWSRIEKHGWAK